MPNIYTEAAEILLAHKSGSLKSYIYSSNNAISSKNSRASPARLYALIMETLKYQDILNEVLKNSGLLAIEKKLHPTLAILLLHDHLLLRPGKDSIALSTAHPLRAAILKHKARLSAELTRARIRRGFATIEALKEALKSEEKASLNIVRWVRVNTLKSTIEAILNTSPFDTFTKVETLQELLQSKRGDGNQKLYHIDKHIPNLLAFPVSLTQLLTNHHLYTTGALILQDKASCFPAHILNPHPGSFVVDACAAPGNKTTHLAAILTSTCDSHGKGKITAFERDPRRSQILSKMVNKAGADRIVEIHNATDFLKSDPRTDPHLGYTTHLLLDPSCSGSGITAREKLESSIAIFRPLEIVDRKSKKRKRPITPSIEPENEQQFTAVSNEDASALETRLKTLSTFQLTLLLHALSFPHAKRVTYSTCSIYAQENEHVVVEALLSPIAKERGWTIDSQLEMLTGWQRRGLRDEVQKKAEEVLNDNKPGSTKSLDETWIEEVRKGCVRCTEDDATGGFFVACFIREVATENSEEPPLYESAAKEIESEGNSEGTYEEWEGFGDEKNEVPSVARPSQDATLGKKKKRRSK
ncbi:S-adenosyl-L-methionine-dependent methyltransferase [Kalaharituber pfeilii]|nr:S-adenosyl-L-methionine-dependent methyltransferase [Kalaharituber pfeilii]